MAIVALTLLGPPSVTLTDGGAIVPQPGAKVLALLTYLVLEQGPHSREELAGLLWGESPEPEARASLRQALKHLRDALGDILGSDRSVVQLAQPIECEVRDFRRLAIEEPERALSTEIPRFLAGFSVRHAPQFDEWVSATRRELLQQYEHALAALAHKAMGQRRWRETIDLAERWLRCDPLSDEAARLAVEARYLSGDRGAAITRFSEYRAVLARETGCEPSRSLLNLAHRVETDAPPPIARPVTDEWYTRAPSFESSLIGREDEWATLVKGWKAARRGVGRIVLIQGEAGVGKSRLAEEFLRWIVAQGGTVLRGHGYDVRAGIPYEPVVEVLREALRAPGLAGTAPEWLTEVTRLVPELKQRFPALSEPETPPNSTEGWRLYEGVAQIMLALAAEQPLAISLDDLQWCDSDSCNLLHFLARRTEHAPVLWLGTLSLGALERDAPAARLCRALRGKAHASVISLGPLTEEDLWRVIREMGHLSTPTGARRFANRIFGVTAGNPFYAIELLKTMFAQGLLAVDEESGEWTALSGAMTAGREFPVSQTVHDVIAERIDRLLEELNDVLITVAVAGAGCRTEVLSHVHGISRLHAAAVGDALVDRRLVVEEGGVYRCAHPVIAHVVRDGLTAVRRREVHRTVALALERMVVPEDARDTAREIARHADRGGEPALAYRFALVASEGATARYAFAEALSWLDLAASNARGPAEADAVNRLTADVLEAAGWSEIPPLTKLGGPITRELEREDFDLSESSNPSLLPIHRTLPSR
ncbi:MAG TPA: AAA family ATPase [Gemmatimonadales bacterium]|nr:AAA family ATPase [Gemmatimonadales bacterium]